MEVKREKFSMKQVKALRRWRVERETRLGLKFRRENSLSFERPSCGRYCKVLSSHYSFLGRQKKREREREKRARDKAFLNFLKRKQCTLWTTPSCRRYCKVLFSTIIVVSMGDRQTESEIQRLAWTYPIINLNVGRPSCGRYHKVSTALVYDFPRGQREKLDTRHTSTF